ncbi:hypothetical protein IT774_04980 [Salinimonas marina]|uniref:Transposase n=1 Tax=Salinimonas marina TaxID=2785918 RepID=A0A7S9HDU7_9ALTE|nr:hypothetical protein [Salinimonas marina]QPG06529.1 hypothetical protein IT774_04980 [Salinimonas marina]
MDARQRGLNDIVVLLLAMRLAQVERRDAAQAVRRCAKRLSFRVGYYPELQKLVYLLATATPNMAVNTLTKVERNLRHGGAL